MSKEIIEQYLASTTHPAPGEMIPLRDFLEGIRGEHPAHKAGLTKATLQAYFGPRILQIGRRDQPKTMIADLGWGVSAPVQVDFRTWRNFTEAFWPLVGFRWEDLQERPGGYKLTAENWKDRVIQRPDYSPERYRIPYAEIAARLGTDEQTMKACLFAERAYELKEISDPWYNFEERVSCLKQRVEPIQDDGVHDYRWLAEGEAKWAAEVPTWLFGSRFVPSDWFE